jgi:hypothetical protein
MVKNNEKDRRGYLLSEANNCTSLSGIQPILEQFKVEKSI